MSRSANLTRAEIAKCADDFHGMLMAIESGEMKASAAMKHRLEGAWVALRMVADGRTPDARQLLDDQRSRSQ